MVFNTRVQFVRQAPALTRPLIAVLTVLAPLSIIGGAMYGVLHYDGDLKQELGNAGRVMNGKRLLVPAVERIEKDLEKRQPRVLILGNSVANTNLSPVMVADQLQLPRRKVRVFSIPNSVSAHWYAILKNRVYANGHDPRLVIVVSSLRSMLVTEPYSEASLQNYEVHLEPEEEVLDRFVPRRNLWVSDFKINARAVHDDFFDGARQLAINATFGEEHPKHTEDIIRGVFARKNMISAPGPEKNLGELDLEVDDDHDLSMVVELGRLAAENGTKLVFVRSPQREPEDGGSDNQETIRRASEALSAALATHGHVFVDASEEAYSRDLFDDAHHMTRDGARLFTEQVNPLLEEAWLARRPHR